MRKKNFLFLLTLILSGVLLTASSITITEPNSGSNWILGETHVIKWSKTGPQDGFVKIRLFDRGGKKIILAEREKNDGSFSWTVIGVAPGEYKVRVKTKNNIVFCDSPYFHIKEKTVPLKNEIRIVSPSAGVSWSIGKTYKIEWSLKGNFKVSPLDKAVKLRLFKYSENIITHSKVLNISNSVPTENRYYNWRIPTSLKSGMYKIRVKTLNNKTYSDSGLFEIKKTVNSIGSGLPRIINPKIDNTVTLDPKYKPKKVFLDLSLGCKIEADRAKYGYKDNYGNVKLKISIQNASSYKLIRKDSNGNNHFITIPGIKLPTFSFYTEIKDSPVMDCEYILTVANKKGETKTSSLKVQYYSAIHDFICPKEVKYDSKFRILVNVEGAKSLSLTDSKGKNYPLSFNGSYRFIKAYYLYFSTPTTFTLKMIGRDGKSYVEKRYIKEKLVVYPK